jgi:DNA ligase (NAD+)
VANDQISSFPTVKHLEPMLSLANSYNADDLKDFDKQIRKFCGLSESDEVEYCVEPKFDGGSISLLYENDLLIRAATRGNGVQGDEMTNNARIMPSVPLKAAFSENGAHKVELRGEALIRKDKFDKINEIRLKEGLDILANPRNAATGALRVKDSSEVKRRGLDLFVFQLGYAEDQNGDNILSKFPSHFGSIQYLKKLGFKVPSGQIKLFDSIEETIAYCEEWQEKRDSFEYEIDGMVVKVNSVELQKKAGSTAHHPRWAIAYKFKAKQATSKLLNVEYQIGKIGTITPVAKIEPVPLAGVTVSSISLHNEEFIQSKDIRIGDTVLVERAGDVIPYIVKSFPKLRDGSEEIITFPTHCPSCNTLLIKEEDEAAWRCPNNSCDAQVIQKMVFHVSKDAMDIDGFGKSYVEKFFELGWLRDLSDIYNLDYGVIEQLEGFGSRSVEKMKKAIDNAKSNPISKFLHSLSIHHLGKKASKLIAEKVNHVLDLKDWQEEHFLEIKDIGPVVAKNVIEYFSDEENIHLLMKMETLGVNLKQTEEDKPLEISDDAPLAGKTILFTGSLQQMGRKEAQKLAEAAGAKNISAVSSNLNILVAGEKAGSKLSKAQKIDTVQIMSEEEFLVLVGAN